MLNDLANYCVPDLITVFFGIPATDFHTKYKIIETVQNTYWIVNRLSVEDGFILSLSLSLSLNIFRVEKLFGLNTTHVYIDFLQI